MTLAVSEFLVGLPIIVLMASIALTTGGSITGPTSPIAICNPDKPSCGVSGSSLTIYTCGGSVFPCKIADGCRVPPFGPPAYCAGGGLFGLIPVTTLIPPNSTLSVPTFTTTGPASSASGVFFGFGFIGASGFIAVIGIIVAVVSLAGISVLGTGAGMESVHILFMGGIMMGIWVFLSGLEGFLSASSGSVFTQMNSSLISMGGAPMGTSLYVLLTLMYLFGFVGMVKRGS